MKLTLTSRELNCLRLLLDSDYRRVLHESPWALDETDSYASVIARVRDQVVYLQDKEAV